MINSSDLRLRDIGFRKFSPSKHLQNYVQCYWAIDRKTKPSYPAVFRLSPDGGVGVVINSGTPFYRSSREESFCCDVKSIVIGVTANSTLMSFSDEVHAIGIRFYPGKSYPFIQVPAYELTDHIVPSCDIGLQAFDSNPELFSKSINQEKQIEILESLLTSRLVKFSQKDKNVLQSVGLIKKHHGLITIDDVSKQLGMSRRHFERRFRFYVGLSPKEFSRIIRIQAVKHHMKLSSTKSLTSIAYDSGFYDQPHFIKEFRAIMGLTPGQYLLEKSAGVSHFYNS